MPRDFLNYLPKSVTDTTSTWDFTSTVQSAMGGLQQMGEQIMQPIGQQIASVMPPPPPPPPEEPPQVPRFSVGSLEDWGFGARAAPAPAPADVTPQRGTFQLPDVSSWMPSIGGQNQEPARQSGGAPAPSDFNSYVRQAAARRGLDPEQVGAVMGKEGPSGWDAVGTFDTGTSYGPLQLHYAGGSNPKAGMGDDFTRDTGIDLRKDSSVQAHQQAVDYALDRLSKTGDFREWYGADPALGDRMTKVKRIDPVVEPLASPQANGGNGGNGAPAWGTYTPETLTPNQFSEGQAQGLSAEEALAVCGPAAAVAFVRANNREPTLREAKELAQTLGLWDASVGMHGPASEVSLLEELGVASRLAEGADWTQIAQEVQAGRPVIVDTPKHYLTVTGYYPETGQFEFGQSAGVLTSSGGRTRFRPDEIPGLGMGAPRATIFMGGQRRSQGQTGQGRVR